jgi:hypothetical protein
MGRAPLPLVVGFALFVLAIAALVGASVARPAVPTFEPSAGRVRHRAGATDTVTLDARDESRWVFFDLAEGRVLVPPDTAGWDLAVRRFHVVAADAAANVGAMDFAAVAAAPDSGWATTTMARDTTNAALARWYRYGMLTHLLTPRGDVHVVRARDGTHAKVQMLSYYCPGVEPGCVTFRWVHPLPAGAAVTARSSPSSAAPPPRSTPAPRIRAP